MVLNIAKKTVCVKKFKPGASKVTGVIDVENVLDSVRSSYFKETYIVMSTRGEVQRWKKHWRNYLMSPQGHELLHYRLISKKGVCAFVMSVINFFVGVSKHELTVFERCAITWAKPLLNWPLCSNYLPSFAKYGASKSCFDILVVERIIRKYPFLMRSRSGHLSLCCNFD